MKYLKWLNINFEPLCMCVTFYLTIALITVQVILRFIFHTGFAWGEEISRFLFVWSMFLSIPYISRNSKHVGVGFVRDLLPDKVKKVILVVIDLLTIYLIAVLLKASVNNVILTNSFHDRATSINISMNWLFAAPVVGYAIMLLRTLQTLIWKFLRFGCSFELFCNINGFYSGAGKICFLSPATWQELCCAMNTAAEEEERQRGKKGVLKQ